MYDRYSMPHRRIKLRLSKICNTGSRVKCETSLYGENNDVILRTFDNSKEIIKIKKLNTMEKSIRYEYILAFLLMA